MKGLKFLILTSFCFVLFSCSDDETMEPTPQEPEDEVVVWTGPKITFTKDNGADPSLTANQDRITSNVSITRGNEGGQIFNIIEESAADKNTSPSGTLWALGTTDDIESLSFNNFRAAVGEPKDVVGKDLVMLIPKDLVAMDIKFTSWAAGRSGGFSYERSTE